VIFDRIATRDHVEPYLVGEKMASRLQGAWFGLTNGDIASGGLVTPVNEWSLKTTSLKRITDGTSKTVLLAEQAGRPDKYEGRQLVGDGLGFPSFLMTEGTVRRTGTHINRSNITGIYGFHARGANLAMCDGSVRFAKESVDPTTLSRLLIRNDGMTIDFGKL
jgi:prepilin-type processing-associated H-X9-DG protein